MLESRDSFFRIFLQQSAFYQAHSQHEKSNVVAILRSRLKRNDILTVFKLSKINASQLILSFGMSGKRSIAQVLGSSCRISCLESSSPGLIFLLWIGHHCFLRLGSTVGPAGAVCFTCSE